jgi:hypothetical protein
VCCLWDCVGRDAKEKRAPGCVVCVACRIALGEMPRKRELRVALCVLLVGLRCVCCL